MNEIDYKKIIKSAAAQIQPSADFNKRTMAYLEQATRTEPPHTSWFFSVGRPLLTGVQFIACLLIVFLIGFYMVNHNVNPIIETSESGSEQQTAESTQPETTTHETTTNTSQSETTSQQTTETQATEVNWQLIFIQNKMYLIPASGEYQHARETGDGTVIWALADDGASWVPATLSVQVKETITGHIYQDNEDREKNIYQIDINDWTGYVALPPDYGMINDDPERQIMDDLMGGRDWVTGLDSQDYSVLPIFDDIYAIGKDGVLKMVSHRQIGGYDYETIEKKGIGDLFGWYWIGYPQCSPYDNKVYYLTSRDGEFYSIWVLDLDDGTEKRFGANVVTEFFGRGNDQLLTFLNGEHYKQAVSYAMISTKDPNAAYTPLTEMNWNSEFGWLELQTGNRLDLLGQGWEFHVRLDGGPELISADDHELWIRATPSSWGRSYLYLNLPDQVCSLVTITNKTLQDWTAFLSEVKANVMTFAEAKEAGILLD